jgi:hypothetical protein
MLPRGPVHGAAAVVCVARYESVWGGGMVQRNHRGGVRWWWHDHMMVKVRWQRRGETDGGAQEV